MEKSGSGSDEEKTELQELRILVVRFPDDKIVFSLLKRWAWSTASKRWCNVPRAGNKPLFWVSYSILYAFSS